MLPKAIHDLIHSKRAALLSYSKIAQDLNLKKSTVSSICHRTGNIKKKTGSKLKLNSRHSRLITRSLQKMLNSGDKITSNSTIDECGLCISKSTMQRWLKNHDYVYRQIKKQIVLSNIHMEKRKEVFKSWLKDRIDFSKVVMTDEKKFKLDGPDNWLSYHLKKNKGPQRQLRQQGGGGLMTHCTVLPNGNIKLFFCEKSIDSQVYKEMLESEILPFIKNQYQNNFIYQHDNAPAHSSNLIKQYFDAKNIKCLKWPPKSPDMNIVEKVWAWISNEVYDRSQIYNIRQLREKIQQAAVKIQHSHKESIKKWFEDFFDKIMKVIEQNGALLS